MYPAADSMNETTLTVSEINSTDDEYQLGRCDEVTIRAPTPSTGSAVLLATDPSANEASCSFNLVVRPLAPDLGAGYQFAAPSYTWHEAITPNTCAHSRPAWRATPRARVSEAHSAAFRKRAQTSQRAHGGYFCGHAGPTRGPQPKRVDWGDLGDAAKQQLRNDHAHHHRDQRWR